MQKKPLKDLKLKVLPKKMQLAIKGGSGDGDEKKKPKVTPPPPTGNPR